jgi:hypothetical protein
MSTHPDYRCEKIIASLENQPCEAAKHYRCKCRADAGWRDPRDESYLRICFAQDAARLAKGLGRIAEAVGKI